MNAADILEQLAEIEADAKSRGIKTSFGCVQLATFQRHNVRAYLSVMSGKELEAYGDDFSSALDALRIEVMKRAALTSDLAAVLGIPVEFAAA